MPLSYSSGQAISFNDIRNHHSGAGGAVSMRDFANGGSIIHRPISDAGTIEKTYNNLPTQAQLDAGTHSININDHLRTTYARYTNTQISSSSDTGSSSGVAGYRTWALGTPSDTNAMGGYSQNWSTGGHSHLQNYLAYGSTWNGVVNIVLQVNSSGYYYITGYGGGAEGPYSHRLTCTGSGLQSSDVDINWTTGAANGGAYSTTQRIELSSGSDITIRTYLYNAQYVHWQQSAFFLMPNGDKNISNKSSEYNYTYY